jgi:hypothetical protein
MASAPIILTGVGFCMGSRLFSDLPDWNFVGCTEDSVKSPRNIAFGQITGLEPCNLQAPSATRLAEQPTVQGVTSIFIVGLSIYALF